MFQKITKSKRIKIGAVISISLVAMLPFLSVEKSLAQKKEHENAITQEWLNLLFPSLLKSAVTLFEEDTKCTINATARLTENSSKHLLLKGFVPILNRIDRTKFYTNTINVELLWSNADGKYSLQSVAVNTDDVSPSLFSAEAIKAFRDSIESHQKELGITAISQITVHRTILAAAERLKESFTGYQLQVFDGSKRIKSGDVTLITAAPAMPDIRAKVVAEVKGTHKMKLEVKYLRPCTGASARNPNQIATFPSSGWQEVQEGKEWKVDFGTDRETNRPMIRGGIAYLIAEAPSGARDTVRFFIKGSNPTVQQVNAFLSQAPYNTIWFFKKIIFHESNNPVALTAEVRQFNPYSSSGENLSESNWGAFSRMPNMGAPCGWGLGQMDNPKPPAQTLWDWQANIIAAYNLLDVGKRGNIVTNLNNANRIVSTWNYPGNPIVTQPDRTEGGVIYTHAPSPNFNHAINTHFNGQLTNNRRSFIDACWIKLYNGLGTEEQHYYWLAPGRITNLTVTPPQWHVTNVATYSGSANYYVRDVSQRTTP